jgi:hypothetical protein
LEPLSPPDLANAVTGFCTVGAGLVTLTLCRFVAPQPTRWIVAYACIFVTGLPTVGFHGWGTEWLRLSDVGTNLLLAFALQVAVLGDHYGAAFRRRLIAVSALGNLAAVAWMLREVATGTREYLILFGEHGGFYAGEAVLILDALLVTGLLYAQRRAVPEAARPLLHGMALVFLVGLGLATAANDTLGGRIWSFHALWHVVGGFGFVILWAFNHVRLHGAARRSARP